MSPSPMAEDLELARAFVSALRSGAACLHPTDTLPGLAFDPRLPAGLHAVFGLKGRAPEKTCLALVAGIAEAQHFFAPLPTVWLRALQRLWPGPLSIVWYASASAPATLVAEDGTIGLRVPALPRHAQWLLAALRELDAPLPTTSVNAAGEAPRASWEEAVSFVAANGASTSTFVPSWRPAGRERSTVAVAPSTVVRILESGEFEVLREGALPRAAIAAALLSPKELA